jgi:hypothetical protein
MVQGSVKNHRLVATAERGAGDRNTMHPGVFQRPVPCSANAAKACKWRNRKGRLAERHLEEPIQRRTIIFGLFVPQRFIQPHQCLRRHVMRQPIGPDAIKGRFPPLAIHAGRPGKAIVPFRFITRFDITLLRR